MLVHLCLLFFFFQKGIQSRHIGGHKDSHGHGGPPLPDLVMVNGELIEYSNHCTPGNHTTCKHGQCCVREVLAYPPEYTGPRPTYRIVCKMMGHPNSFCMVSPSVDTGMCPCQPGLTCRQLLNTLGHCTTT